MAVKVRDKTLVRVSKQLQEAIAIEADGRGMTRNAYTETCLMLGMSAMALLEANSYYLKAAMLQAMGLPIGAIASTMKANSDYLKETSTPAN